MVRPRCAGNMASRYVHETIWTVDGFTLISGAFVLKN